MYGTVARLQVKPGADRQLIDSLKDFEKKKVDGFVSNYLYRMDADAATYYLAVIFNSREAYVANAVSPEQNARYLAMLELLTGPPTWHDGQVVYSHV
jgi:hypothetical protein